MPFLLGAGLALAAEPAVRLLQRRNLRRGLCTAIAVSGICVLSLCLLLILTAVLGRQLQRLTSILPQMVETANQGTGALRQWLLALSDRLPPSIRSAAANWIHALFSSGASLWEQAAGRLPQIAGNLLSGVSDSLLWLITTITSAYMLSIRLPALRQWLQDKLPFSWRARILPTLRELRHALGGWLLAELKLAGMAFLFLCIGFLLLRVKNGFVWALLTTLVDAFPILGVGTVLIPWSLVCLLQGNTARGIGLLALYGAIWLIRSILEPKLIGKELGLDPLVTLIAIYAGWRLWGIPGMLFSPILTLTIVQVTKQLQR